jgi:hypothetical protein
VAEWLKAHAWKACLWKRNVGSNPILSAKKLMLPEVELFLFYSVTNFFVCLSVENKKRSGMKCQALFSM